MAAGPDTVAVEVMAQLDGFTEQCVRTLGVEITANLQETTPVDTGFAQASWIPSVGSPSSETGGAPGAPNPGAAQAGLASVANYTLSDGKAFVSNNAAYIQRLDRGHSQQAPAGFVRAAVEKGNTDAAEVLRQVGNVAKVGR